MSFDNALWKAALTGIASNTNAVIIIHLKRQIGANQLARLCAYEPLADAAIDGLPLGGSCIKALLHVVHGVADVNELSKPIFVHLYQEINLLSTALRKLYDFSPPCGAGVDRHALTSPSVVHCQFFELFRSRRSTASKLASRGAIPLHKSCYYAIGKFTF